jgi:hypothetical protein
MTKLLCLHGLLANDEGTESCKWNVIVALISCVLPLAHSRIDSLIKRSWREHKRTCTKFLLSTSRTYNSDRYTKWNYCLYFEKTTKMKSCIFWDIMPFSPLKANRVLLITFLMLLPWFILRHWRWIQHFPPKLPLTLNGLHGLVSQMIELLITAALRISNHICYDYLT